MKQQSHEWMIQRRNKKEGNVGEPYQMKCRNCKGTKFIHLGDNRFTGGFLCVVCKRQLIPPTDSLVTMISGDSNNA